MERAESTSCGNRVRDFSTSASVGCSVAGVLTLLLQACGSCWLWLLAGAGGAGGAGGGGGGVG